MPIPLLAPYALPLHKFDPILFPELYASALSVSLHALRLIWNLLDCFTVYVGQYNAVIHLLSWQTSIRQMLPRGAA